MDIIDEETLLILGDEVRTTCFEFLSFVKFLIQKGDSKLFAQDINQSTRRLVRSIVKLVQSIKEDMFVGEFEE